jgi:hypothetical protein
MNGPIPEKFLDALGINYNPDLAQLAYAIVVVTNAIADQPGFDKQKFRDAIAPVAARVDQRKQPLLWSVLDFLLNP